MALEVLCRKRGLGKVIRKKANWVGDDPLRVRGATIFFLPGSPETSMGPTGDYFETPEKVPAKFHPEKGDVNIQTNWPCGLVSGANTHTGQYFFGACFVAVPEGDHEIEFEILTAGGAPTFGDWYPPFCMEMRSTEELVVERDSGYGSREILGPPWLTWGPLKTVSQLTGLNSYFGQTSRVPGEPENYVPVIYGWYTQNPILPRSIPAREEDLPAFVTGTLINVRVAQDGEGNDLFLEDFPQHTLSAVVPGREYALPSGIPAAHTFSEVEIDGEFVGSGRYQILEGNLVFNGAIGESSVVKVAFYPPIDNSFLRAVIEGAYDYRIVNHFADLGGRFYVPSDLQGAIDSGYSYSFTLEENSLIQVFSSWAAETPMPEGMDLAVRFTLDGGAFEIHANSRIGDWGWEPPYDTGAPSGPAPLG